jgi:hypothetical protein
MKVFTLPLLAALALCNTLALPANAQVKKFTLGAKSTPSIQMDAQTHDDGPSAVNLCDSRGCRPVTMPPAAGNVTQVVQGQFVDKDKAVGSFLAYSDHYISVCYVGNSGDASTCAPVATREQMRHYDVELRRSQYNEQYFLFTPVGPAPSPVYTNELAIAFMRNMARVVDRLNAHAKDHPVVPRGMARLLDEEDGDDATAPATDKTGSNDDGAWESGWPSDNSPLDTGTVTVSGKSNSAPGAPSSGPPTLETPPVVVTGQRPVPIGENLPPDMLPWPGIEGQIACIPIGLRPVCGGLIPSVRITGKNPTDPNAIPPLQTPDVVVTGKRGKEPTGTLCERYGMFCGWFTSGANPKGAPLQRDEERYAELADDCDKRKSADDAGCYALWGYAWQDASRTRGCLAEAWDRYSQCLAEASRSTK